MMTPPELLIVPTPVKLTPPAMMTVTLVGAVTLALRLYEPGGTYTMPPIAVLASLTARVNAGNQSVPSLRTRRL
jgi:hypothetical protein